MWMLVPVSFTLKLLSAFLQPLGSLWSSLRALLPRLRAAFWLAGGKKSQQQRGRRKPRETSREDEEDRDLPITPTSVNYHFTRQCNYKCGFCFHTAKTSFVLPLAEAKRGLLLLKEAGESGPRTRSGAQLARGRLRGGGRQRAWAGRFPQSLSGSHLSGSGGCPPARGCGGEFEDGCLGLPNPQSRLAWG